MATRAQPPAAASDAAACLHSCLRLLGFQCHHSEEVLRELRFGPHMFSKINTSGLDAVLHFDETRAVEPLDASEHWQAADAAETYPAGL